MFSPFPVDYAKGPRIVLGLNTGTSADALDCALIRIDGLAENRTVEFLMGGTKPYPPELQERVRSLSESGLPEFAALHHDLGSFFGEAARQFLDESGFPPSEVSVIGSHGQTVWHHDGRFAEGTLQLGSASVLAERALLPVVADFRWADIALGGQGAPISPWADWVLHRHFAPELIVLNMGGIANVTVLNGDQPPRAWDTGPANGPLDALARRFFQMEYDTGGQIAMRGKVNEELVQALLADPYFKRPAPKSTGLERFGASFVELALSWSATHAPETSPSDYLASLTEAVGRSIAESLHSETKVGVPVFICGGGAHNLAILKVLRRQLGDDCVFPYESMGWDADLREAVAFALLADAFLCGEPSSFPSTTDATRPALLGSFHPIPFLDRE